MTRYLNLDGSSEVADYTIGRDRITVVYEDGEGYVFTYRSAGTQDVEEMKRLAVSGRGLDEFISTNARHRYEHRAWSRVQRFA